MEQKGGGFCLTQLNPHSGQEFTHPWINSSCQQLLRQGGGNKGPNNRAGGPDGTHISPLLQVYLMPP